MAAVSVESQQHQYDDQYAAKVDELARSGQPLNLTTLSEAPVFKMARTKSIDVSVYSDDGTGQDITEGLFTIHSRPSEATGTGQAVPASAISGNVGSAGYPEDADILFITENLTKAGFTYTSTSTGKVVTRHEVSDRMALTPTQLAQAGLAWSPVIPNTLVSQGTITDYIFNNTENSTAVVMRVYQPTTSAGDPVGNRAVSVAPMNEKTAQSPGWGFVLMNSLPGVALGYTVGMMVFTLWPEAAAGGAVVVPVAGAVAGGAAAGGGAAGAAFWGPLCVAVLVGIAVTVLVTWGILWLLGQQAIVKAQFMIESGPPAAISTCDGVVVLEGGSVRQLAGPPTPPLPGTGNKWVGATRTVAINDAGELWSFN